MLVPQLGKGGETLFEDVEVGLEDASQQGALELLSVACAAQHWVGQWC